MASPAASGAEVTEVAVATPADIPLEICLAWLGETERSFTELAKAKGVSTIWVPIEGGHCSVAPTAVARFLAR